jgi:hypothetical protein
MSSNSPLFAPMKNADHREVVGIHIDTVRTGEARVKRVIYPVGFHWAKDMKDMVGTDLCKHAHVGFLAHGRIHVRYADGCVEEFAAPQVVRIDPGHDGWVDGDEPAVLIEFDFENQTVHRLGLPNEHKH